MWRTIIGFWLLTAGLLVPSAAWAQQSSTDKPASAVALGLIASVEKAITGVAQEMPDDKYEFVPTTGAFRGVRTFSKQIKHAAALQFYVANTMLGETVTADMAEERGPDSVRTKAEVVQYLNESFDALKRAARTLDQAPNPLTRLGSIAGAVSHTWNHYGQIVPYLRMNGLTPPQ